MKDIIAHLGSQEFWRIRVGVGEKPAEYDLADYVLGRFGEEERALVDEAVLRASEAAHMMAAGETEAAMNLFNKKVIN